MSRRFVHLRAPLGASLAAALALGLAAAPLRPAAAATLRAVPSAADAAPAQTITLSVSTGQLITLPRAVSDVFIADDKVADVQPRTPTRLYVFGKAAGETSLSATDKSGAVVFQATVRVGTNMAGIGQMLKMTMADSQITATPMNGMVVLTGTVKSPDDVAEATRLVQAFVGKEVMVVPRLKTATPLQVMLRVRIAEVSRDISQQIGVNFLAQDHGSSGSTLGFGNQGDPGTITTTTNASTGQALTTYAFNKLTGTGTRFGLAGHFLGLDILSAIDLAETNGLATTLAQPSLTALSGETASFLAGGEIPIPVPQFQGVTTIEYKQYGVSLAFTPTVLGDGRISLRVRPEVSQLTDSTVNINGYKIPGITTRRAETTVELGSGQSFAIGGLLNNTGNNSVNKAPFLGDLPILGALFRSNSFKKSETELVIVITPYLVRPVSDARVALPTDGYRTPTTLGRVFLDQMAAGSNRATPVAPRAEPPVTQRPAAAPRPAPPAPAGTPAPGFSFN
ncbi:type II and III secretion system protein family protein [Sphingomonas morindae]|uniref:Type II and III secretion system protein family protein n=1 Tax=Sphingomonas morindae TaxID=1541170 RepID=A0ABY4X4W9_9SPHN|nr:type II and III secretion system protein family protein [Sphingomonas morindae]USI71938.1 type II and III secretion system protein family protein [Sphingomonas morindae]